MTKDEIIERLRNDDDYYGDFGNQFLSNSHIRKLDEDPRTIYDPTPNNPNFVVGGYLHTAVLEPHKLEANYPIVDATTRNTKKYKEVADENILILKKEADNCDAMKVKLLENDITRGLIKGIIVDYEEPGLVELNGLMWKGKADILNHDEKLIVDLKTTSNINKFSDSARKYNYDSQAYIYKEMFGYDMLFLAIDKKTHQIGLFDCSEAFYESGRHKVDRACELYEQYYGENKIDFDQHVMSDTL